MTDLTEQAVTIRLTEALGNVLAAKEQLMGDEFNTNHPELMGPRKVVSAGADAIQWFERGELPPAGIECEARTKGDDWARVLTIGLDSEGNMVVEFLNRVLPYHGCARPDYFRPL